MIQGKSLLQNKVVDNAYNTCIMLTWGDNMNIRTNLTIPEEIVAQLKDASKELGLTQSAYVSMAIKNQIDRDKMMKELPAMTDALQKAMALVAAQAGESRP